MILLQLIYENIYLINEKERKSTYMDKTIKKEIAMELEKRAMSTLGYRPKIESSLANKTVSLVEDTPY